MTLLKSEIDQIILDPWKRLNTLYFITNKSGMKIPFRCNWAQEHLYRNSHYCNIILKARQLGISTYICLLFLDRCLFNPHVSAGIICHTREDAEYMFRRIKFAYDTLPEDIKRCIPATIDSARDLCFANGSSIRVGTSMRGSTLQYLHVSEFGKICAKFPDKAQEIVSGSLNTIAPGQHIFIESTAEGREGYFYDMCKQAQSLSISNTELTELDFKFHFFPWWKEPGYSIGSPIAIKEESLEYFESLLSRGVSLNDEQKWWYCAKYSVQGEDMLREYPSTPDEAWEQSNQGLYYGRQIITARLEKRISFVPYDESVPVHTAWDLGYNDSNAIWFFQIVGKEIHLIDYVEGSGESLAHWLGFVLNKPYIYGKHLAPHDILAHEYTSGMSRQSSARKMGINLIAVPKVQVIPGIDQVRLILNRCWFDEKKCSLGIRALEAYKKEWDDRIGCWRSSPLHNWSSHGADSFRYLATGLHFVMGGKEEDGRTLGGIRRIY